MSFKDLRANVIPKFYLPPSSHKKVNKLHKKPETQKHLCRRVTKYTRVIPKRPMKLAKRVYKDDIDKKIVKKMGTRRAKWLEPEEEPVMLCKVGDIIMNGMKRYKQQVVPFTVVRDVLHRVSPMSKYKTSRAIQRYWKKMQKGPYAGLEGKVANLFKLKPINDTFVLLLKRIDIRDAKLNKPFRLTDPQISSAYIILMSYIFRNKKKILDALEGNLVNNDHLSDDHIQYTEETAVEIGKKEKKYFDAKNEFDIKRDIVKSIIHSSLCAKEVTNFSNQLFKIYQNYPDIIIKEAVKELRDTNTISYRSKRDKKANVWDTPFFLSQFYIFFQCSTFNNVSADEAFNAFTNITKHRGNSIEGTVSTVQNKRYGQLLGISEFFSFYSNIRFIFYFPQNTIMLNPEIDNHDELVNELAIRYQLKLKEGNETEMDFETENDNYRTKSNDQELIPIDEDKEISDLTEQTKSIPSDNQDTDLAVDSGNSETISRLKTWITDYIATDSERRSPSPEFIISHTEMDEDDIGSEKPLEISEKIHGEQGDVFNSRGFISTEKNLIPTLDEIKEGMLKTNINDEERTIPHITELSDLLTKHFNDLKMDTDTLLRLKNHFITEYATLDRVVINEFEHLQDHYMVQYLDNSMKNKEMWNRIENGIIVRDFLTLPNYEKLIRTSGGSDEDVELASEIIQFAANKELFGATGSELKEAFLWRENKCTLTSILKSLLEAGILLQMGIATLSFVHYKYHYAWVVERKCIALDTPSTSADLELQGAIKSVRMKIMPWVRVNGQLDKSIFKNWITNLLSYSLDFPKITFGRLCEKFCYIKPVDLYYLLQILEELGCIELFIYENKETNLFTEWSMPKERYATCLDNLEDIVIQPHNVSLTRLGSFFYNTD